MMVIQLKDGCLRQQLNDDFNSLNWMNKLGMSSVIADIQIVD